MFLNVLINMIKEQEKQDDSSSEKIVTQILKSCLSVFFILHIFLMFSFLLFKIVIPVNIRRILLTSAKTQVIILIIKITFYIFRHYIKEIKVS